MARVVSIRKALPPMALPGAEILPGKRLPRQRLSGKQLSGKQLSGKRLPGQRFSGKQLPGKRLPGKTATKPKFKNLPYRDRNYYGIPRFEVKKWEMDIIEPFHRFTTTQFHGLGEEKSKSTLLSNRQVELLKQIRLANGEIWSPSVHKDPKWHEVSESRCQSWEIRRNQKIIRGLERETTERAKGVDRIERSGERGSGVEGADEDDDDNEE